MPGRRRPRPRREASRSDSARAGRAFRAAEVGRVATLGLEGEEGKGDTPKRCAEDSSVSAGSHGSEAGKVSSHAGTESGTRASSHSQPQRPARVPACRQRHYGRVLSRAASRSPSASRSLQSPPPPLAAPAGDGREFSSCGEWDPPGSKPPTQGESRAHAARRRGGAVPVPPPRHSPRGGRAPGA